MHYGPYDSPRKAEAARRRQTRESRWRFDSSYSGADLDAMIAKVRGEVLRTSLAWSPLEDDSGI